MTNEPIDRHLDAQVNSVAEVNASAVDIDRREFLKKTSGIVAMAAGLLGFASLGGAFDKPQRTSGYGSSTYAGTGKKNNKKSTSSNNREV